MVIYCLSPVSDKKQTARQRTPACGSIAQLGEHLPYKQGVTGSSPVVPTTNRRYVYGYRLGIRKISEQHSAAIEIVVNIVSYKSCYKIALIAHSCAAP